MGRLVVILVGWALVAGGVASCAVDTSLPAIPAVDLTPHYRARKLPDWQGPLADLAGGDPARARAAAAYLVALLRQAQADELSGRAPTWPHPDYRHDPLYIDAGYLLRRRIADGMIRQRLPVDELTLPIYREFLYGEERPNLQVAALAGLAWSATPAANRLLAEIASRPHPNGVILAGALEIMAERRALPEAETLASLAVHHRGDVRRAARAGLRLLGRPEPPAFDPVAAMRSEPIRRLLERLAAAIDRSSLSADRLFSRELYEVNPGAPGLVPGPAGLEAEVRRIEELRRQMGGPYALPTRNPEVDFEFRDRDRDCGIVFGFWLHRAGRPDLAARVLLPLLEELYGDDDLLDIVLRDLGDFYGNLMLISFVGDRDYERALELAEIIDENYPHARFHGYAKRLREELPRRREDFRSFRLPTVEEWREISAGLSREERIRYLCRRLRLLNCHQWIQPGDVEISGIQYREPRGMNEEATVLLNPGKTVVINPYAILSGQPTTISYQRVGRDQSAERMTLTTADVPILRDFQEEDWYLLAVRYQRNFFPDRQLLRTRPLLDRLIALATAGDQSTRTRPK